MTRLGNGVMEVTGRGIAERARSPGLLTPSLLLIFTPGCLPFPRRVREAEGSYREPPSL